VEFGEKLQQLRKRLNLTQEGLAQQLYVSRTAISKWESGRGYPSIDSLKAIAAFFKVSLDALMSGEELLTLAESDAKEKTASTVDLVFGILDCMALLLLVLPLFGQREGDAYHAVSLVSLQLVSPFMRVAHYLVIFITISYGLALLATQKLASPFWVKYRSGGSILMTLVSIVVFILAKQPYAGVFLLCILVLKGILLIKNR